MSLREQRQFEKLHERVAALEASVFRMEKAEETSLAQQILILKYLGILGNVSNVKKKQAKFLAKLLNRSEEHIRRTLSKLTEIETIQNFGEVRKLYNELGMKDICDKIDKDIKKLEKL